MHRAHAKPDLLKSARTRAARWARFVALMVGTWALSAMLVAQGWAAEIAQENHPCCCAPQDSSEQPEKDHSCAAGHSSDGVDTTPASHPLDCHAPFGPSDCDCSIEQDSALPSSGALSLTSSTLSFATTTAHIPHPQLRIPLARAPDIPDARWLSGPPPPQPIYILTQTLRI